MSMRLTKSKSFRLRCTVYVAPGRAEYLRHLLNLRGIPSLLHSDSTVRVECPVALVELYERTGVNETVTGLLREYAAAASYLKVGQKRSPAVVEELERLVEAVLDEQGD